MSPLLFARLPVIDAPRLVFADGRFRADLSTLPPTSRSSPARPPDFGVARAAGQTKDWSR